MKRLIVIILAVALLFAFASTAYAASPIIKDQYFARSTLSGNELEYYDYCYVILSSGHKDVYPEEYGLSDERGKQIGNSAINDAPELFNYYGYYSDAEVKDLNERLNQKSSEILGLLNDDMSEYEKVKTIYYYLGKNIEYDNSAVIDSAKGLENKVVFDGQTIIGGLINGKAVCAGMSRSFQYLLYQIGIPCYCVEGSDHMWNLLQVDGEWYYADLTHDEKNIKRDSLDYFLRTDDYLKYNGLVPNENNPPLPACTSDKFMTEPTPAPTPTPTPTAQPVAAAVAAPEPPSPPPPDDGYTWLIGVAAGALVLMMVLILKHKKTRAG